LEEDWRNDSILHHKNIDCQTSLTLQQFLVKNQSPPIPQAPYSLWNFSVLFKVQEWAKGLHIAFIEEIQHTATTGLTAIQEEDLQKCFQQHQNQ